MQPGARLGPYEIQAPIGSGGMGDVYKARDLRLGRTVAIKVLQVTFATDPEFHERFNREARTISRLANPNICVLYDIGTHEGSDYLVMEFLDGQTLATRLTRGKLPLSEALLIAIQIASALDHAHRSGITHRDLKPANVMLTKSGAKLLDFGLAKPTGVMTAEDGSTLPSTAALTAQGTLLGTLQYMAPEQLEGRDADARTDIFAFGCVLYEMLTGKKAFDAASSASVIAAIMQSEPASVSELQPLTPPVLDRTLRKCLAKDPANRWQSANDLCDALRWLSEGIASPAVPGPVSDVRTRRTRRTALRIAAVGSIVVVGAVARWLPTGDAGIVRPPLARVAIMLPDGDRVGRETGIVDSSVALSPDGTRLAYVASHEGGERHQQLYIRMLDELNPTPLSPTGTEGADSPFFSPDGQWLGFFAQGKLKKVSLATGAVQDIADAVFRWGGSWSTEGTIFFPPTNISGLWRVSASGGAPEEVTHLDRTKGEVSHRWPQVLPGGKAVLFTVWSGVAPEDRRIQVQSLDTGERRVLVEGADMGRYVSTGHLVYITSADQLMAVPMDLNHLKVTGSPVALAEHVRADFDAASFAISESGELAYVAGGVRRNERQLEWIGRHGDITALPITGSYIDLALSPDGRRAAVQRLDGRIWIYDFARGTLAPVVTGTGGSQSPIWTPDGTHVVYRGTRLGFRNLFSQLADSAGEEEERLTRKENTLQTPGSVSPDGKWLAWHETNPSTDDDVFVMRLDEDRQPQAFVATRFHERQPQFSPDGRWIAYKSDKSGRFEIYVQSFPGSSRDWQVSTTGGTDPVWSKNGRELFYLSGEKLMSVDTTTAPTFSAGLPKLLVSTSYFPSPTGRPSFDVSPDGQRFLMIRALESDPSKGAIQLVMNWVEELKQRVPVR